MKRQLGLQLYTLREETAKDFSAAIKQAAEVGYTSVEFAGFGGLAADKLADLLKENNLTVCGAHIQLTELEDSLSEVIAFNKAIHNQYLVIPFMKITSKADIDDLVARINVLLPKVKKAGLTLAYHNHDFEFTAFDGVRPIDELLSKTEILLELDTFWAYSTGNDPAEFMRKNRVRIALIHLKDGIDKQPMAIGDGKAPCKRIYQVAKELNISSIIVENDFPKPDGFTDIKKSIRYINENF